MLNPPHIFVEDFLFIGMSGTLQLFLNFLLYVLGGVFIIYVVYYKIILFFFKPHHNTKSHPKLFPLSDRRVNGSFKVEFMIPEEMQLKLYITGKGNFKQNIAHSNYKPGTHVLEIKSGDFQNGDYMFCLESKEATLRRMVTIENARE